MITIGKGTKIVAFMQILSEDCFIVCLSYIYSMFIVYLSYIYSILKVAIGVDKNLVCVFYKISFDILKNYL